jgi:DNA-binding XRE family transcriptional regulator
VPFCHLTFSTSRPALRRYERTKVPAGTLGAAFRERRWSRGLEQWQAAKEIGVSVATYRGWEVNRAAPIVKHLPDAIAFLGFDWRDSNDSFGDQIRTTRTRRGLSIREAASEIGIDPTTLRRWEVGDGLPSAALRGVIETWLAETTSAPLRAGSKFSG